MKNDVYRFYKLATMLEFADNLFYIPAVIENKVHVYNLLKLMIMDTVLTSDVLVIINII